MSDGKKLKEGEQSPEQQKNEVQEHINANHLDWLTKHAPKKGKAVKNNYDKNQ
jgi:hypothetical protein